MKNLTFLFVSILLNLAVSAQQNQIDSLYFGQTPPGAEAEIFAPEVISISGRYDHDICFSADGKEMLFSVSQAEWTDFTLYHSYWTGEKWSDIKEATLTKNYKNTEAIFAPNSKSVYYASSCTPGSAPWDFAIFKAFNEDTTWGEPAEIGIKSLQPTGNDGNWHPSVTNDSTVYFSSYNSGNYNIYYSQISDGSYSNFKNVGSNINSNSNDWYPWISPDEKTLLFSSNRAGGYGNSDLYVSFKSESNEWGEPVNLGEKINTTDDESSPRITYDGKYFFFTRTNNWDGDFYWIKAEFIDNLRESGPITSLNRKYSEQIEFYVYPNPSKGIIKLYSNSDQKISYQLINLSGVVLISGVMEESSKSLDLANLSKGMYILRYIVKEESFKTMISLY